MLKKRVIPVLLLKDGRMIKTKQFRLYKDTGDPMTTIRVYDAQGADELVVFDISASTEGRGLMLELVSRIARECFIPLTVGGGIRTTDQARTVFAMGADRVSISTAAVMRPDFVDELAQTFGRANVVVCIDAKLGENGEYLVSSHSGERTIDQDPVGWAVEMAGRGAGEIVLHFVDRDGMMNGYDLKLLRSVVDAVDVPVMACGGVGTLQDLVDGVVRGGANSVAAASIFHFTDQSPIKAHSYMHDRGVPTCLI